MLRVPAISERSGRYLISVLLLLKLLVLGWNAYAYDGRTYDEGRHEDRAVFAGLRPGELAYDPPLYYLPAGLATLPDGVTRAERFAAEVEAPRGKRARIGKTERAFRAHLLDLLRYSNLLWVGGFYLGWIGYALPRLLGGFGDRWFLASLLLLTLPGFQKVAAMSHPENLLLAASTLSTCVWLRLREGGVQRPELWLAGFALATALVGLTRPTALVPVIVFTALGLVYARRLAGPTPSRWLPRAAALVLLVAAVSGSWYFIRYQRTGAVTEFMTQEAAERARASKAGFNYAGYFVSFRAKPLLATPHDGMGGEPDADGRVPRQDSFFTVLYSDVWGDHWLSFSGPKHREGKLWPKRTILTLALLLPSLLALLLGFWARCAVTQARALWRATPGGAGARLAQLGASLELELVLLSWSALGALLFVCWQAGPALLPGDQHSIKFIHVASLFAPATALLFMRELPKPVTTLLAAYLLLLYCAAFPVAMYWPA